MSSSGVFVFTVVFFLIGIPLVYYVLWKQKKRDRQKMNEQMIAFNAAIFNNDRKEILRLGLDLVWNQALEEEGMNSLIQTIERLEENNPERDILMKAAEKRRSNWGHQMGAN